MKKISCNLKICVLCIVVVSIYTGSLHAQPSWVQKSSPGFSSGSGVTGFSIVNKGYIIGDKYALGRVVWEYDPATDVWTQKAWYPGEGEGSSAGFGIGSKGYLGLGYRFFSGAWQFTKDFWEFDPIANTWIRKADFGGAGRRLASGFSIGPKGYIGVGLSGGFSFDPIIEYSDFWEYDPSTNAWVQKANFPFSGAYKGGAFSINTKGYLCAGKQFWEYDPTANSWTRKTDFPGNNGSYPGFSIGNKGYMGLENNNASFYAYDQPTNSWNQVADFPAIHIDGGTVFNPGREQNIAFSIGSKGYLGQGRVWSVCCGTSVNDFWEFTPQTTPSSCIPFNERAVLDRLHAATDGSNWTNPWVGNDETTWFGITISGCHVTEIDLSGNSLSGTLPQGLEALTSLVRLDLSKNALTGSLPQNILSNVLEIDLSENSLNGPLPTNIGSSLLSLDFSKNQFTDPIPSQIGDATQLTHLNLSFNQLTGSLPTELGNAAQLIEINLSNNKITGIASSIWNIPTLQSIDLSYNEITGPIPIEIGNSLTLNRLNLSKNKFTGTIPPELISPNDNLKYIYLSANQLTGSVPAIFADRNIILLDVSSNQITDLPPFLIFFGVGSIDTLRVENNRLSFEDLEPSYQNFSNFCCNKLFSYSPQIDFEREIFNESIGNTITLSANIPETSNTYFQWFKGPNQINGQATNELTIDPIEASDQGIYKLSQRSFIIPDLELTATLLLNLNSATGIIPLEEREALIWFYYSTGGENWSNNSNWLNNDESTWYGVSVANGHVVGLNPYNNNLNGTLPSEIGNLSFLESLGIYYNFNLRGRLPTELGNLTELRLIYMPGNGFSGPIPSSLGNLSKLDVLYLSDNYEYPDGGFTGSIPSSIGNLTLLNELSIDGDNNLTGGIPSSFKNLINLSYLTLNYCNISSIPIDVVTNLSGLFSLDLSYNQITGTVPKELRFIYSVRLSNNQLVAPLPLELGTPGSVINSLNLGFNLFSGPIQSEISSWSGLAQLDMRSNDLSGNIPPQLGNMNLQFLSFSDNELTGTIPVELADNSQLRSLLLDYNQLSGAIPKELGSLSNIFYLKLDHNQLSGSIPVELSQPTTLYFLYLNNNQLTGTIPVEFGAASNLRWLYLGDNQLTGNIPVEFSNLINLNYLDVSYNQLSGSVPPGLSNASNLYGLYLDHNQFTGSFPASIGSLPVLSSVRINNNQFTDIPLFTSNKYELKVEGNLLDFGDLEPNVGKGGYTYSPQGTQFPGGVIGGNEECLLSIPFSTNGSSNIYKWAKDGTTISGATSMAYSKQPATTSDAGSYVVTVTNSSLPGLTISSLPFAVTISPNPLVTPTTTGASGCSGESLLLTASGGTNGEYRWYNVASGGSPITGVVNDTYTTPNLTATTTYYVSSYNGPCETARVPVIATISEAPTTAGNSGCINSAINLQAFGGTNGQYRWYTSATGGSPISGETNDTFTTPLLTTSTNYFVSIDYGACESSRKLVTASISTPPNPLAVNGTACGTSTVLLSATGATNGQYRWYTAATGGTAIIGEINSSYTTPSITATTTYYVSINNGTCESSRTAVVATINSTLTAPTTSGSSSCGTGVVNLTASGGTNGQYRWYDVAAGGTALTGEVNSSYTTPSITATTTYYVSINNGTCESTRTSVVATINSISTAPPAIGDSLCEPGVITLTASGGTNGQYRWYDVATGGTALTGEVNSSYTTPSITATTTYYVSINNGTCESNRTSVVATINTTSTAPATTGGSLCGPGVITITASGGTNGQYRWYDVATGGTALTGEVNSTYTTPSINSTTTYYVSVNDGTCESTRTSVVATINSAIPAPTTTGGSLCGAGVVTLTASGGTAGQYRWYNSLTGGTAIGGATNATYSPTVTTSPANFFVAITNGTCESSRTSVTATLLPVPAKPVITASGPLNVCTGGSVTLTPPTGYASYLWSDASTTNQPRVITSTTTLSLRVTNASNCTSVDSDQVVVTVAPCPPTITTSTLSTTLGGSTSLDLTSLITTQGTLDPASLIVKVQPPSGANATIVPPATLKVDYTGIAFAGEEIVTIEACDVSGACTTQVFTIKVDGTVIYFNAISANGDDKNPVFYIQNIDLLPETKNNKVSIFNRWGDLVWEGVNYNNTSVVFTGANKNGNELPTGTYFYKIEFVSGRKTDSGYLSLKR